jgi:hypothetical protein
MDRYRKEGKTYCIDLTFQDYSQLYDNRDPAPFIERDLDQELVRYLLMCMREIPEKEPKKIVLKGPTLPQGSKAKEEFVEALHRYFSHEIRALDNEVRELLIQGRTSFFFGISFLVICLFLAMKVIKGTSLIPEIFREGLVIMGWVALWKPINLLLYEWWPHLSKRKTLKYLSTIKVEFI